MLNEILRHYCTVQIFGVEINRFTLFFSHDKQLTLYTKVTAGSARAILPPHTTRAEPQATPNIWKWQINTSRAQSLIARLVDRLEHAHTIHELDRGSARGLWLGS